MYDDVLDSSIEHWKGMGKRRGESKKVSHVYYHENSIKITSMTFLWCMCVCMYVYEEIGIGTRIELWRWFLFYDQI